MSRQIVINKIKPIHLDTSIQILKNAAQNDEIINYDDLAFDFFKTFSLEDKFQTKEEMKNYWFSKVLTKGLGIFFPRNKSNKLTTEQLKEIKKNKNIDFDFFSRKFNVKITWDDVFVGYNSYNKPIKKRNKNKEIAEILEKELNLSIVVGELVEEKVKNKDIIYFVNNEIKSIPTLDGVVIGNSFISYYLYSYLNLEKKARIKSSQRNALFDKIKSLLKQDIPISNLHIYINQEFGTDYSSTSMGPIVYMNGLTRGIDRKRGRKKKYISNNLTKPQIEFIIDKYSKEGWSIESIKENMDSLFDVKMPRHGLNAIIKDLHIKKGKISLTLEQKQWLRRNAADFLSSDDLVEKFNHEFSTTFQANFLLKNSVML